MTRASALALALLLLAGCSGEPITTGLTEPIHVQGAQFHEGDLPGLRPRTIDEIRNEVPPQPPAVTALGFNPIPLDRGYTGYPINGRTTTDAVAIGVTVNRASTGYWLVPVGAPDPTNFGQLTWDMSITFNRVIEPGLRELYFAAIDAEGRAGTQSYLTFCIQRDVPDNGNVCDATTPPPALVVSLGWEGNADLDLRVITPSGKIVDAKSPTTAGQDEDGGVGVLDRDSNAGCAPDGRRRENLIFQETPAPGKYYVYANLFDSCGDRATHFDVSLHSAVDGAERGTYGVVESYRQPGELLDVHANGGRALGLFVTEFSVQ